MANAEIHVAKKRNTQNKQNSESTLTPTPSPAPKKKILKAADMWDGNCIDAGKEAPIKDTPHHEALKAFVEWEKLAGCSSEIGIGIDQIVCEHFTYMKGSPYYRPFLEAAKKPTKHLDDPDWHLAWSHATMIAVGILIARREFGRRLPSALDARLE